jgi:hypothetical protein
VVAFIHLEHGKPGTGDGIATPFSFDRQTAEIKSIRIVFTGDTNLQPNGVGLAFDSFSPASQLVVPGPAQLQLSTLTTNISMTITGTPQAVYAIEAAGAMSSTNWQPLTSIVLPGSPFTITNLDKLSSTQQFYRAVGLR